MVLRHNNGWSHVALRHSGANWETGNPGSRIRERGTGTSPWAALSTDRAVGGDPRYCAMLMKESRMYEGQFWPGLMVAAAEIYRQSITGTPTWVLIRGTGSKYQLQKKIDSIDIKRCTSITVNSY